MRNIMPSWFQKHMDRFCAPAHGFLRDVQRGRACTGNARTIDVQPFYRRGNSMKLTVIGGGGVRSIFLAKSIAQQAASLGIAELCLMDNDQEKLSIYGGLAAVWIVERDDTSYHEAELRRPLHALAQHWLNSVAGRFDDLFGEYVCLGHMSNGEGVYRKRH